MFLSGCNICKTYQNAVCVSLCNWMPNKGGTNLTAAHRDL